MKWFSFFVFSILFSASGISQNILMEEDFNDCEFPEDWNLDITNGMDEGFIIGYPVNTNSDSLSIDGTCMLIFDDDNLGNNTPAFKATITTPRFLVRDYSSLRLSMDISFRAFETSYLEIFVLTQNDTISLRRFDEDDQTGSQFSQATLFDTDLRFFTDAEDIAIMIVYDDLNLWAWYAGIDNVRLQGTKGGEIIFREDFNDCNLPEGWESEIRTGTSEWVFGMIENENTSSTSMNGTCFAYFDDDGIGRDAPFSIVDLRSPVFDGSAYANFVLDFDLIFRKYGDFENISVFVFDGTEYYLVKEFIEPVGGDHFTNYKYISLDLSAYRSEQMQVVFRYEDGFTWGWWVGIDNVKVVGSGTINDICGKAIPLTIGAPCQIANNMNAVTSGDAPSCFPDFNNTLWYEVVADRSGLLRIENESDYNDILNIYTGDCSQLTEIKCTNADEHGFDGEILDIPLEEASRIYLRTSGIRSEFGKRSGLHCLAANWISGSEPAPVNDVRNLSNPILEGTDCVVVNNKYARVKEELPEDNLRLRSDVWLHFDCQEDGDYRIFSAADFSEELTIYASDSSGISELASQSYGREILLPSALAGRRYLIQIGGIFSSIEGESCIRIEKYLEENNGLDNCMDAMPVAFDTDLEVSNLSSTFSGIYPGCNLYSTSDIWMHFNSAEHQEIYLKSSSSFPFVLAVYSGQCDNLTEIWCSLSVNPCQGYLTIDRLEPNTNYYLQLASNHSYQEIREGILNLNFSLNAFDDFDPLSVEVHPRCLDGARAVLEIEASGGSGSYRFDGNAATDTLFSGDTYLVVVTDDEGCEFAKKGTINCQLSSCMLDAESFVLDLSCATSDDGSIVVKPVGGMEPYSFLWSDPDLSGDSLTHLKAGLYRLTMTDGNLCVFNDEFVIHAPQVLAMTIISEDESGPNQNDGTAVANVIGGNFPYHYYWSDGSDSPDLSNLEPGIYSLTVEDNSGCTIMQSFNISAYDCSFEIQSQIVLPSCYAYDDGAITLSSDDNEIVNVAWNTGASGLAITQLSSGQYQAVITRNDGCEKIENFVLDDPDPIIISIEELIDVSCFNYADGQISLNQEGGIGSVNFSWDDGTIGNHIENLPAGVYKVVVTDEAGCSSDYEVTVNQPEMLSIASSMSGNTTCHDSEDGMICIFVEGGTSPYVFEWTGGLPGLSKITDLPKGEYILSLTDSNNCLLESSIAVEGPDPIAIMIDNLVEDSGIGDGKIDVTATGGTAPYAFKWWLEGQLISSDEDLGLLGNGIYTLQITDANDCYFEENILLGTTSVSDAVLGKLELFPNPARDFTQLKVENNLHKAYSIDIISAEGKLMNSIDYDGLQSMEKIMLAGYPAGSYLLKVYNNEHSVYLKLIIQN